MKYLHVHVCECLFSFHTYMHKIHTYYFSNTTTLKLIYLCSFQQLNDAIFLVLNADLVAVSDVSSQAVFHHEGNICLIAAILGGCFGVLRILFS